WLIAPPAARLVSARFGRRAAVNPSAAGRPPQPRSQPRRGSTVTVRTGDVAPWTPPQAAPRNRLRLRLGRRLWRRCGGRGLRRRRSGRGQRRGRRGRGGDGGRDLGPG